MNTTTKQNKTAMAREALARNEDRYTAHCHKHGETEHYSSAAKCVICQAATAARRNERIQSDPERREAWNAYRRTLLTTSASYRGQQREATAANDWLKATGGTLTGLYELERPALQRLYGAMPEGFDGEHGVPKRAYGRIDGKRQRVASGLNTVANIAPTPSTVNKWKGTQFSPDTNRLQRPANRGPGGAFDPMPTAHELELIANGEYEGTPASISLKSLKDALDSQAQVYEAHVAVVESDLCVRYSNAIALMLGYVGCTGMMVAGNEAMNAEAA